MSIFSSIVSFGNVSVNTKSSLTTRGGSDQSSLLGANKIAWMTWSKNQIQNPDPEVANFLKRHPA